MHRLKRHYQKGSGDITQNVTNKSNVTRHRLNTGSGNYPDPAR